MLSNDLIKNIASVKDQYVVQEIDGEVLLVPVKQEIVDFNFFITLNEVGAFIWETIDENQDENSIVQKVSESFDADENVIKSDVIEFISELDKALNE